MTNDHIRGVSYTKPQTEYQLFPESYFSGADVSVYFEDTWVDDITGLSFQLQENVMPIFGYNSYTWDSVARGSRTVQGQFSIAYKKSGYLYDVLINIADKVYNPKDTGDTNLPAWLGNIMDKQQDILNHLTELDSGRGYVGENQLNPASYKDQNENVRNLQYMMVAAKQSALAPAPLIENVFTTTYHWSNATSWPTLSKGSGINSEGRGNQREYVKYLQHRLNTYLVPTSLSSTLATDGQFGPQTKQAVKKFQKFAEISQDGVVGPNTKSYLSYGISSYDDCTSYYGVATKLGIASFQAYKGLRITGNLNQETIQQLKMNISISPAYNPANTVENSANFIDDLAYFEDQIWNAPFEGRDRSSYMKSNPYFYSEPGQEWMLAEGFDIYINYGPVVPQIKSGSRTTFDTTVTALRNVQIQSIGQQLGVNGQPIAEIYSFIAQDIN